MDTLIPLSFAAIVGFTHAFEADHLLAVSNIVTRRRSTAEAIKDGVYWGLGHTSTILLIGLMMVAAKVAVQERTFGYFEAVVGLMLVVLGAYRLWNVRRLKHTHEDGAHTGRAHDHSLAYGVGLIHGLAGSGALILLAMSAWKSAWEIVGYLLIFGIGSIFGMTLASGIFSLPFSKKIGRGLLFRIGLTIASSILCIVFGLKVIWEHLFQA